MLLLVLIGGSAVMTSRDYRARQTQTWLRSGQMQFSARIQGEQRLEELGDNILEFLADYMGAQVGAVYVTDGGVSRRVAGYALPPGDGGELLRPGEGLHGQAAKQHRPLHVKDVPEGYLPVTSSLGRGRSRELLIAPAMIDGAVRAIVELGFFREVEPEETELLARVTETLGIAVRSSLDRTRLEELLAETQRQSEELQTQQEELRVSNEELEVQSRALKESQVQLEAQQAELEQTNSQLEEQAQILEHQKDELTRTQGIVTERAAELERANQYKSEFLANMSHELRTPLNSALILAKILGDNKQGNLTGEQVKYASTIASAGKDLLALINDILDLSKIEAGKVEVVPEPVSIARTVDALTKTFEPLTQEKRLTFEMQRGARHSGSDRNRQPAAGADPEEPALQCVEVHRARHGQPAREPATWQPCCLRREGHGDRHPDATAGHHLRSVQAGGWQHASQVWRHGPRPFDLARSGAPARR